MIPILKTERLILRPLAISDRDAMVDLIMSDMDVMEWLPLSDQVSTPRGQRRVAQEYILDFIKHWDKPGFGVWAVCKNNIEPGTAGTFVGYCGFIPEQIKGAGPEIVYAIGKPMWGKGVATEAVTACLDWIFVRPDVLSVHAVTDRENQASQRVMEKVGMRHERNIDLYDSVAKGEGLLPFYTIGRAAYLQKKDTLLRLNMRF